MDSTGSLLRTAITRLRNLMDEAATDGKYNDDYIIRHIIKPSFVDVVGRLNQNSDAQIIVSSTLALVAGQQYYTLPPNVGQIRRLYVVDDAGFVTQEGLPRGNFNPEGHGWRVEGNALSFKPYPLAATNITIDYVPTGDILPQYGTTGAVASNNSTLTLAATPSLGGHDRRPNSYVGQVLRVLGASQVWQERIIATHDVATGVITPRLPFDPSLANTSGLTYEIVPFFLNESFIETMVALSALKLGTYRKVPMTQYQQMMHQYQISVKTLRDQLTNLQGRTGKSFDRKTEDNEDYSPWSRWSAGI